MDMFLPIRRRVGLLQHESRTFLASLPAEEQRPQRIIKPSTPQELSSIGTILGKELVGGESALRWLESAGTGPEWDTALREALTGLNRKRDYQVNRLPGGLIIVLPNHLRVEAVHQGDLFSQRSFVGYLDGEPKLSSLT